MYRQPLRWLAALALASAPAFASAQECQPGSASPSGLEPCTPCPEGFFQGQAGGTSCDACPSGVTSIAGEERCIREDEEFLVNTYTTGIQLNLERDVAADGNGNFVVVWVGEPQDGSGYGVFGQRFDTSGTPLAGEFQVNQFTSGHQRQAAVAGDLAGNFVATWASTGVDGSSEGVAARLYDATGSPLGGEFLVNSSTTGSQSSPSVAQDAATGSFVVVWQSSGQDGSGLGVFGRRFTSNGTPQGSEFPVNTYTSGDQAIPRVAATPGGGFVVVWHSAQDGSGRGIFGQRFSSTGARKGVEFQVNSWTSADQFYANVASDNNGRFLVIWGSQNQDGDGLGAFGKRFNASGAAMGGEFQINTYTTSGQFSAAAAYDPDDSFVILWQSFPQDGSSSGIYGKRYSAAGAPVGGEFRVNSYTTQGQAAAAAAALGGGRFVVTWTSYGQAGELSAEDIYAQRFAFSTDTTPPTVQVLEPNGGETLFAGADATIDWTASDNDTLARIDVAFSADGGASWAAIPTCFGLPGTTTSCSWSPGTPTTQGRVRVTATDAGGNTKADASNGPFKVRNASIDVTVPDAAGVAWQAGSTKAIKLVHNLGKNQPLTLELSRDGGGSWTTLTSAHLTTGATGSTFNWLVTAPITSQGRVRATWDTNPSVEDTTTANFSITSRVKVTTPNTAVNWAAGSTKAIKWSHNLGAAMTFELSLDDGDPDALCNNGTLATGVSATTATAGSYPWLVAGSGPGYRVCVTAQSADPANDTDVGDVPFTITP